MTGALGPGKGRLAHRFNGHCRIAQKPCNPDLTCSITTKSPNPDPITACRNKPVQKQRPPFSRRASPNFPSVCCIITSVFKRESEQRTHRNKDV